MTSKACTRIPAGQKLVKLLNDLALPFLWLTGVVAAILSCFEAEEGSNSRTVSIVLAIACFAVIFAVKMLHKRFSEDPDSAYRFFRFQTIEKFDLVNLVPLLAVTLTVAVPFYMLFVTSIKNPIEANSFEFSWWPKQGVDLNAYADIFDETVSIVNIGRSMVNSFVYAFIPCVVGLLASAISAYAFSKLRFRASAAFYSILIMTMMMPGCVTMATSYLMYDWYGWTNSPLLLIIPGLFGSASTVMFLREYFMGIPNGLLEAAEIDGAGTWRRFFSIMLPLAKPALTAQFILGFISGFNNYMGPLIYLNDLDGYTIQIALTFISGSVMDNGLTAAACVFALVPMLILYIVFQNTILDGISISSGIKG